MKRRERGRRTAKETGWLELTLRAADDAVWLTRSDQPDRRAVFRGERAPKGRPAASERPWRELLELSGAGTTADPKNKRPRSTSASDHRVLALLALLANGETEPGEPVSLPVTLLRELTPWKDVKDLPGQSTGLAKVARRLVEGKLISFEEGKGAGETSTPATMILRRGVRIVLDPRLSPDESAAAWLARHDPMEPRPVATSTETSSVSTPQNDQRYGRTELVRLATRSAVIAGQNLYSEVCGPESETFRPVLFEKLHKMTSFSIDLIIVDPENTVAAGACAQKNAQFLPDLRASLFWLDDWLAEAEEREIDTEVSRRLRIHLAATETEAVACADPDPELSTGRLLVRHTLARAPEHEIRPTFLLTRADAASSFDAYVRYLERLISNSHPLTRTLYSELMVQHPPPADAPVRRSVRS